MRNLRDKAIQEKDDLALTLSLYKTSSKVSQQQVAQVQKIEKQTIDLNKGRQTISKQDEQIISQNARINSVTEQVAYTQEQNEQLKRNALAISGVLEQR